MPDRFKLLKESFQAIEPNFQEIGLSVLKRIRDRFHKQWAESAINESEVVEVLRDALIFFVENSDYSERIAGYFRATGIRYYSLGVRLEHYEFFIEEWLKALESSVGRARFQSQHRAIWLIALQTILRHLGEGISQTPCQFAS